MSIKLRISPNVTVKVEGTIRVESSEVKFDFEVIAERLPQSDLAQVFGTGSEALISETLVRVARDWRGVFDGDAAVPYSAENLAALLEGYPGLGALAIAAYLEACGARGKRKN